MKRPKRPKAPRLPERPQLFEIEPVYVHKGGVNFPLTITGNNLTLAELIDVVPDDIPLDQVFISPADDWGEDSFAVGFYRVTLKPNFNDLIEKYESQLANYSAKLPEHRKNMETWRTASVEYNTSEKLKKIRQLEDEAQRLRKEMKS